MVDKLSDLDEKIVWSIFSKGGPYKKKLKKKTLGDA
jgi:hypothetical protein